MEEKRLYDVKNSPYVELETPFTIWEGIKMAILLPTVPIRLFVILVLTIAVALVNSLAIYGCDIDKPLPHWRRRMVEIASQTYSAIVLRLLGFWNPRVINPHYYLEGKKMGAIGIFNHVSYLDAFVVVWAFCACGVTFAFSKHIPILGYGVRALQNLYLPEEKDKGKQSASVVQMIKERAANRGLPMLSVAPEGTLSNGRCLLRFKTGAFVAGTPVVPFLLRYKLKPHNPAWTIMNQPWHLLRLMCQFQNYLFVEVLPPYVPSQEEKANPALYAANIRKLIAEALNVPMVDQDRSHFLALVNANVSVSWDARRVIAPPGVLDDHGMMDIEPYMPANYKKQKAQ